MTKRIPLIAANWKMNPHPGNLEAYKPRSDVDVVVFPSFLDLKTCIAAGLTVGGQFGHHDDYGPHTGDISLKMLKDLGCQYVLCGHSERRQHHGETNEFVASQAASALKHDLHPIVCVGETWEERKAVRAKEAVTTQIEAVLSSLPAPAQTLTPTLTVAYEPVWAIGTGNTATPKDAQEMHAFIRSILVNCQLPALSAVEGSTVNCRILYGGSMKPENAEELLSQPDIDGGLVGNASLDPGKFRAIVEIASKR